MSNTHPKHDGVFVGPYEIKLNPVKGVFEALTSGGIVCFSSTVGAEVHDWALAKVNPEVFGKEVQSDSAEVGRDPQTEG